MCCVYSETGHGASCRLVKLVERGKRVADKLVAIILAAGYSRRFGSGDKRLARLPDGRTLLAATLAGVAEAFPLRRVVLREKEEPAALELPPETPIIPVRQARLGLGSSLAEAMTAVCHDAALAGVESVAILLGDMPDIRLDTYLALQRLVGPDCIVRPRYAGRAGHPVLIGRDFWEELQALEGDEGARSVLARHRLSCVTLDVDDPGVCQDIDSFDDLALRAPGN